MSIQQDGVEILEGLGLTLREARVYLTLVQSGKCTVKAIVNSARICQPDVYKTLNALQRLNLIEKVIDKPAMFKAVPIEQCIQSLSERKEAEHDTLKKKTEHFLSHFQKCQIEETLPKANYRFTLIPPKRSCLETRRKAMKTVQTSIDGIGIWNPFPRAVNEYYEETIEALRRGVKMRALMEKPDKEEKLPKEIYDFMKAGSYEIRYLDNAIKAQFMIIDRKVVNFDCSLSTRLDESAILSIDNPCICSIVNGYFEIMWRATPKTPKTDNPRRLSSPVMNVK
jgi:sugar-specific transcriptional regulator TrmB